MFGCIHKIPASRIPTSEGGLDRDRKCARESYLDISVHKDVLYLEGELLHRHIREFIAGFGIKYTCAEERTPPHRAPPGSHRAPPGSHHGALSSHHKRPPRPDAPHLTPPPQTRPDKARCSGTSALAPLSMESPEQRPIDFMMDLTNAIALLENMAHSVPSNPTNGDRSAQDHQDRERWLKAGRRWWRAEGGEQGEER